MCLSLSSTSPHSLLLLSFHFSCLLCLSVCLPAYLPACLSVCLSACLYFCLHFCLSVFLCVFLSLCLSVCLSLSPFLYTSSPSSPAFYGDPSGTTTSVYELTVQINSYLILSCGSILFSIPSATYSWRYSDDINIVSNTDRAIKGIDGDLYLPLLEENNIDTYRCTAVNPLLGETKFVEITLSSNGEFPHCV